jgi:hypothetical protein
MKLRIKVTTQPTRAISQGLYFISEKSRPLRPLELLNGLFENIRKTGKQTKVAASRHLIRK